MSGREGVAVLDSPDIAAVHVDPGEVEAPVGFQRTVEPYPGLARQGRNAEAGTEAVAGGSAQPAPISSRPLAQCSHFRGLAAVAIGIPLISSRPRRAEDHR